MAIEARNRPLTDWFTRIRTGQLVLPRFQRFEAWDRARVSQLLETILRSLPVGALLVLEIGDKEPFVSRAIKGAPQPTERASEHLLDGQQRLTALWRSLHNNYEDATYFIAFEHNSETGQPLRVHVEGRWQKIGETTKRPFWSNEPKEQWVRRLVPLDLFLFSPDQPSRLKSWFNVAQPEDPFNFQARINEISMQFSTCNLPFLSLPSSTPGPVALDVFMKMNTTAAPLSMFDIIVAQVEAGENTSLHDLVADLRAQHPEISGYYSVENLVLYASALLQGHPPSNSTYLDRNFGADLVSGWEKILKGVRRTLAFLTEERVFDADRLPTDVVIPVLTALWANAPDGLDAEGRARTLLRRYLWRAFFTNRYESSTNTRALADYEALRSALQGHAVEPPIFDDQLHPLPQPEELARAGWPKRRNRLARAVLAIAMRRGGCDLADGSSASRENLSHREYHHLFPNAFLKKQEKLDSEIFVAVNCALVTWRTNRNISDKSPEHYLAERLEGTDLGMNEVRARLATHLIPYDEMVAGDYSLFVSRRAEMLCEAMTKVCLGISIT